MRRRQFIKQALAGTGTIPFAGSVEWSVSGGASENSRELEMNETTVSELQAMMLSGELSAVSIAQFYLRRIRETAEAGPALHAVIELNPAALPIARELAEESPSGQVRGPLHGIPVLLKDNIDTSDRMMTTAGSLALLGHYPKNDSFIARRLRGAGAVILGKSNLSEWANFRGHRSTSGWSARGGQTKNPYVLDRNPSGSSSGSAVAVAANLCSVAVGTETDGSIVSPSSVCGIVGIKPTVGLVSRSGIIPISASQDTAGPMARTVADAAALLGVMAGTDEHDPATSLANERGESDYTKFLDADGLRGVRIGVCRQYFGRHEGVDKLMHDTMATLKGLGAVLVDPVEIATLEKFGGHEGTVLHYEFKDGLNRYLAGVEEELPVHTLQELIEFNERNADQELPHFGQEHLIVANNSGTLQDPNYLEAREAAKRLAGDEGIDAVMQEHRLDALLAPTTGPAHLTDHNGGDRSLWGSSSLAAVAGYPSITVPNGRIHGLPVGVSFFGRAWSEPKLIQMAYAFEQTTAYRAEPGFVTSLD
jgi:amidase